jgi:hypothetical protein
MTKKDIDDFEKIHAQLEALHYELSILSKKSHNDSLNKFKLKFVNQVVSYANKILGDRYKPFLDFNNFIEEDMPTTSDVVMILNQYLGCFEKLRADNIFEQSYGDWYWVVNGKVSDVMTIKPKKIKEK